MLEPPGLAEREPGAGGVRRDIGLRREHLLLLAPSSAPPCRGWVVARDSCHGFKRSTLKRNRRAVRQTFAAAAAMLAHHRTAAALRKSPSGDALDPRWYGAAVPAELSPFRWRADLRTADARYETSRTGPTKRRNHGQRQSHSWVLLLSQGAPLVPRPPGPVWSRVAEAGGTKVSSACGSGWRC